MSIHPFRKAQIDLLNLEEALHSVPNEYSEYVDAFLKESAAVLPEHTCINKHATD